MIAQRVFQILAGYENGNDCNDLRDESIFKLAAGRDAAAAPLASQPTISRFENQPGKRDLIRLFYCQLDAFIDSYRKSPDAIVLDVDPTACLTYGQQELQLYNTRIRLVLLKSAARVTIRKTYVQLHLGENHPLKELWQQLAARCRGLRTAASG